MDRFRIKSITLTALITLLMLAFGLPLIRYDPPSTLKVINLIVIFCGGLLFSLSIWLPFGRIKQTIGDRLTDRGVRTFEKVWITGLIVILLAGYLFEPLDFPWAVALLKLAPAARALLSYTLISKIREVLNAQSNCWVKIGMTGSWLLLGFAIIFFEIAAGKLIPQIYPVLEFITLTQLFMILLVGGTLAWLLHRGTIPASADFAVFIAIWLSAAWIWNAATIWSVNEVVSSLIIPTEDARIYDATASLIAQGHGQTLRFGSWANYAGFLASIKLLAGIDPLFTMRAQVALLGAIPGLLFLIGRELGSRPSGVLSATLAIVSNYNSIINPKSYVHMASLQTEPLMALGLILIVYVFIKLVKDPKSLSNTALFGGLIGFFSLVRINILLFLIAPIFPHLARKNIFRQKALWSLFAALLGFALIVAPIWARNYSLGYEHFFFGAKLSDLSHRLGLEIWPNPGVDLGGLSNMEDPELHRYPFSWQQVGERAFGIATYDLNYLPRLINDPTLKPNSNLKDHLFLRQVGFDISAFNVFSFLLNLALVVWGIVSYYRFAGLAGLAPAAFYGLYFLTTIFSSSLIPRHVFPIAWIPILYYPAGILSLWRSESGQEDPDEENQTKKLMGSAWIGLAILLAVTLVIPVVERELPSEQIFRIQKNENGSPLSLPVNVEELLDRSGIAADEIVEFLESEPKAALSYGRIYYPAEPGQVPFGSPEESSFAFYDTHLFPEVSFLVTRGTMDFVHGEKVLILYCIGVDQDSISRVYFVTSGLNTVHSVDPEIENLNCP